MGHADYRKINDGSHNSSTYHKKDGTAVRQILNVEAEREACDAIATTGDQLQEAEFVTEELPRE